MGRNWSVVCTGRKLECSAYGTKMEGDENVVVMGMRSKMEGNENVVVMGMRSKMEGDENVVVMGMRSKMEVLSDLND